jgi:hypothetical protein
MKRFTLCAMLVIQTLLLGCASNEASSSSAEIAAVRAGLSTNPICLDMDSTFVGRDDPTDQFFAVFAEGGYARKRPAKPGEMGSLWWTFTSTGEHLRSHNANLGEKVFCFAQAAPDTVVSDTIEPHVAGQSDRRIERWPRLIGQPVM